MQSFHIGFIPVSALFTFLVGLTTTGCERGTAINIGSDPCDLRACGAEPEAKYTTCADGTQAGPTGQCLKTSTGSCAWEYSTCAATCSTGATKTAGDSCNQCTCTKSGVWDCTKNICSQTCSYLGVTYADGTTFDSTAGGCKCSAGVVTCSTTCTYDGKSFGTGSSFPSTDGCNTCSCDGGTVVCTKNICPNPCEDAECAGKPKPDCGTLQCADGSTAGCTNKCLRDSSGVCGWEVRQCPTACKTLGEVVILNDSCQQCTCTVDANWTCKNADPADCGQGCVYGGIMYVSGQQYSAGDGCNTCTCTVNQSICTQNSCTAPTPDVCDVRECTGDMPSGAAYQCPDGSLGGVSGRCLRDVNGVCNWEVRKCSVNCKLGDQTLTADGCGNCACGDDLNWTCTEGQCAVCPDGDLRFIEGGCPACTVGMDQTCNDDPAMSSLAGTCIRNLCKCNNGFGRNPQNGKCKLSTATAASACTPGYDQTCNGNLEDSSYEGRCFYDGTCLCINGNVLDTTTGLCVHPKAQ